MIELGTGTRRVGAIALPCKRNDRGVTIVRLDRHIRENLGVTLGELVTIRAIVLRPAHKIIIAPVDDKYRLVVKPEVLHPRLVNRPLVQGEVLFIMGKIRKVPPKNLQTPISMFKLLGSTKRGSLKIKVVTTDPYGIVVVGEDTELQILEKYPQSSEKGEKERPLPYQNSRVAE